ncbi:FxDxF family PEP-CTERM protein [Sphingomonas nostoxanthinifaciens]|uniref:FxDxF family PEP-CTERM protein n=1 Tax=Sphingomonas nostoxanthinifaciens TaxID=2872652 RepID=UPI001CC214EE|nr:FxDxF family PEP-CTERM protein [Sphingomonas nostoxanthinifaciens]UAK24384.1 FxDxF family PEP-CTERM protein [Sphingomonas nostoxanthinifaciens]
MTRSMYLAALATAATLAGTAQASSISYTNGDTIAFTSGSASINGSSIYAPVSQTDVFTFDATAGSVFSGTISTHLLRADADDPSSMVLSNLDFTSVTLTNPSGTSTSYAIPGASPDETVALPTSVLAAAGLYTLSIAYNVTAASAANSATYDGGLHLSTGAVPEVATWAMFVVAFGMVGGSVRRRKTVVAFA